jgi:hypothetical protein
MKIEPCPICGEPVLKFANSSGLNLFKCRGCSYTIGAHDTEKHNRLSRIVRAAEEWAVADAGYRTDGGCMEWADRLTDARRELRRAVEGGRAG